MIFEKGEIIGAYKILGFIGSGGAGHVFKAEHTVTKRIEALKTLTARSDNRGEQAQRFLREIQIHASLSHANIASIHNAFWTEDHLVMAMEFVEGESLKRILEGGRLPLATALDYGCQALSALEYAHAHQVIHRDITPGNMLVTTGGTLKLTDFGVAKGPADLRLTQTGALVGSLYYMSPEQVRAEPDLDGRTDIYSLGAVLYEIVTGMKPFDGDSPFAIMSAQVSQDPPLLAPTFPVALRQIIAKALAKDRKSRFQSATEFLAALETVRKHERKAIARRGPSLVTRSLEVDKDVVASEQANPLPLVTAPQLAVNTERRFGAVTTEFFRSRLNAIRALRPSIANRHWYAVALSIVVVAGLGAATWSDRRARRNSPPPAAPQKIAYRVPLQISPEAARVSMAGQDLGTIRELSLGEGSYEIEVALAGHKSQRTTIVVTRSAPAISSPIALQPLPTSLNVHMSSGTVALNNKSVEMTAGNLSQDLGRGDYTLQLVQNGGKATVDFRIEPGTAPEVTNIVAKNMAITAVTLVGQEGRVYTPENATALDLSAGTQLYGKGDARPLPIDVGDSPTLQIFVTDPQTADLLVNANEENATVLLNGIPTGAIRNGKYVLPLKPDVYTIAVEKPGFASSPPQKVRLQKGTSPVRTFTLTAAFATITVNGAPDAQLFLDGLSRGVVPPTGVLEIRAEPGKRRIALRKDGFKPIEVEHTLRAQERLSISSSDLLKPLSKLQLTVTPSHARALATHAGDQPQPLTEAATWLAPGDYQIVAEAPGFVAQTKNLTLRPGEVLNLSVDLLEKRPEPKSPPPSSDVTIKGLTGDWKEEADGWWSSSGGDQFSLLNRKQEGTIRFQVQPTKTGPIRFIKKERASWVAFFLDAKNHLLFELEAGQLTVTEVVNGLRKVKERLSLDKDAREVKLQLTANRALLTIGKASVLEIAADRTLFGGKFGFKSPSVIKEFRFAAP